MACRPLMNRFQYEFESNQIACKRAAAAEKATRTRRVQAEASQALTSATTNNLMDIAPGADPVPLPPHETAPANPEPNFAVAKEEVCPNHELNLRMSLQVRLQVAEERIGELEWQIKAAREGLKESILQDEVGEIQRQRRVIANLIAELSTVEDEREALRKQFLESEVKLFELERENRRLQHGLRDLREQDDLAASGVPRPGDSNHDQQSSAPKKARGRPQTTKNSNPKLMQLGRQHRVGLYLTTRTTTSRKHDNLRAGVGHSAELELYKIDIDCPAWSQKDPLETPRYLVVEPHKVA